MAAPAAPPSRGKGLLAVLAVALLSIFGAIGVRLYLKRSALRRAKVAAALGMARDTFGGFRDVDRALRDFVGPHSSDLNLIAQRSYALAQLASRYGDDQAAVDSELLNAPLERALQNGAKLPPLFFAARALLLLANSEPGSALLLLSGSPPDARSAELSVVRAQVLSGLEKPADARAALAEALAQTPPELEALLAGAQAADQAHDLGRAAQLGQQAVSQNPSHWPSLLLLADLALQERAIEPAKVRALFAQAERSLPSEASPAEQCRARLSLAQLDLLLGNLSNVAQTLDRGGELDEAPPQCRAELARLDLRLGRNTQALALLAAAASDEEPGTTALDYAELSRDPAIVLTQVQKPLPGDLGAAPSARFQARVDALKLSAAIDLGQRKSAAGLPAKLEGWEIPQVQTALARFRATGGDPKGAAKLVAQAIASAERTAAPGDDLARVGEQANALGLWSLGAQACAQAALKAPGNYRALVCQAQAFKALHRNSEALAASERAMAINADGESALRLHAELSPVPPAGPAAVPLAAGAGAGPEKPSPANPGPAPATVRASGFPPLAPLPASDPHPR